MAIRPDASVLQPVDELIHRRKTIFISGDHDTVDLQVILPERIDKSQHLQIISYTEVLPCLVGGDIAGIDTDDDLHLVLHLVKELYLGILIKAGQYSHGMLILHQLPAELQIKPLSRAFAYPFQYIPGLFLDIFFRAETYL